MSSDCQGDQKMMAETKGRALPRTLQPAGHVPSIGSALLRGTHSSFSLVYSSPGFVRVPSPSTAEALSLQGDCWPRESPHTQEMVSTGCGQQVLMGCGYDRFSRLCPHQLRLREHSCPRDGRLRESQPDFVVRAPCTSQGISSAILDPALPGIGNCGRGEATTLCAGVARA